MTLSQNSFHLSSSSVVREEGAVVVVVVDVVGVEYCWFEFSVAAVGVVAVGVETDDDVSPTDSDDNAVSSG